MSCIIGASIRSASNFGSCSFARLTRICLLKAADTLWQQIAAMKTIVPIGVIVLVAFGIFAVLSLMQRESTNKLIQADASGFFQEKKQEAELARRSNPEPISQRPVVS